MRINLLIAVLAATAFAADPPPTEVDSKNLGAVELRNRVQSYTVDLLTDEGTNYVEKFTIAVLPKYSVEGVPSLPVFYQFKRGDIEKWPDSNMVDGVWLPNTAKIKLINQGEQSKAAVDRFVGTVRLLSKSTNAWMFASTNAVIAP